MVLDQSVGGGQAAQTAMSCLRQKGEGLFLPRGVGGAGESRLGGGGGRGILLRPLGYGSLSLYVWGV